MVHAFAYSFAGEVGAQLMQGLNHASVLAPHSLQRSWCLAFFGHAVLVTCVDTNPSETLWEKRRRIQ